MPRRSLYLAIVPVSSRAEVIELRRQLNYRLLHGKLSDRDYAIAVHVDDTWLEAFFKEKTGLKERSLVFQLIP
jgi:hypothetical protein